MQFFSMAIYRPYIYTFHVIVLFRVGASDQNVTGAAAKQLAPLALVFLAERAKAIKSSQEQ